MNIMKNVSSDSAYGFARTSHVWQLSLSIVYNNINLNNIWIININYNNLIKN